MKFSLLLYFSVEGKNCVKRECEEGVGFFFKQL